jgi:hypothetical protein
MGSSISLPVDRLDLAVQGPHHALDAAHGQLARMLEAIALGHAHLHQLPAPRHQLDERLAALVEHRRDLLGSIAMPRQHLGELAQDARVDAIGLGQHSHRLGKVARLARARGRADGQV